MRITIFEMEQWEQDVFQELTASHQVQFVDSPLTAENAPEFEASEIVSTFIYSQLNSRVLQQLKSLKMIATRSTGFDHIDLDHCQSHGVAVCNVPSYGESTVAEHVFGLLLSISHNLREALDRTRKGDFSLRGLRGFDLRGKTLGVVGTGNIGRCVVEIARGFRMEVVAHDIAPDHQFAEQMGFRYLPLGELLSVADIVTLHVPAGPATHHLISEPEFRRMKPGVVIINTARGNVLDIRALVEALADGRVAAAGLDVLPEEPAIREEAELLRSAAARASGRPFISSCPKFSKSRIISLPLLNGLWAKTPGDCRRVDGGAKN